MMSHKVILPITITAVVAVGILLFLDKKEPQQIATAPEKSVASNSSHLDPQREWEGTTSSPLPQGLVDDAFGKGYTPKVAKVSSDYDGKWALDIPLRSQEKNLVITSESWMENATVYDKQLTELERDIKVQSAAREKYWTKILANDSAILNEKNILNADLASTTFAKKIVTAQQKLFQTLLNDRDQVIWGTLGKHASNEQLSQLQPLWSSLIDVTGDCSFLLDKKATLDQQQLSALDSKDKVAVINTEADIRTVNLVYSWHQNGYDVLNGKELSLKMKFSLPQ